MGKLTRLVMLSLDGIRITSPPEEIVVRGVDAVLEWLRSLDFGDFARDDGKAGKSGRRASFERLGMADRWVA